MSHVTLTNPRHPDAASRLWNWLRSVDEAIDHDPTDALRQRIAGLEARIDALEQAKA